jgi:hypothetical protein
MCVWDVTFAPSEEEREALDQVLGWRDDPPAALPSPRLSASYRTRRASRIRAVPAYRHREPRRGIWAAAGHRAIGGRVSRNSKPK